MNDTASRKVGLAAKWQRAPTVVKWLVGAMLAGASAAITVSVQNLIQSLPENFQSPLEISVSADRDAFKSQSLGQPWYLIPSPDQDIPTPPGYPQPLGVRQEWAEELGGVDAEGTDIQVVIRGRNEEPVILTDLKINVLKRSPPMEGVAVGYCRCGGEIFERFLSIDLDASPPVISGSEDLRDVPEKESKPIDFPYQVSATEPEVFYIFANTSGRRGCFCTWNAELFYSTGDRVDSLILDNEGEPFQTTAVGPNTKRLVSLEGEPLHP